METMQATVLDTHGGPERLAKKEIARPAIAAGGEVLVRLKAAGVNPLDTKLRAKAGSYPLPLPAVLGCDGAGVVEAVGAAVRAFKPGDEVFLFNFALRGRPGSYAQYTVVDHRLLARKPAALSFEQAAAVPLALITAWESLRERASVKPGDKVLIHAGAGGVGHFAIQLAKLAGAQAIVTAGSEEKAAFARSFGADSVIPYKERDFVAESLALTEGRGVDIALDTVGGKTFGASFAAVRPCGDVVTLLQPPADTDWSVARGRNLRIGFELMLMPVLLGIAEAIAAQGEILRKAATLFDQGKLRVHVDQVLPLADAAEAHRLIEAGQSKGKLVLAID